MTDKQRKFADEYLIDCNGTRAYKAAYPSIKNDNVARVNSSRLLTNANVKDYIEQKMDEMSSAKIASAEEVIQYLTSVMRGEHTEQTLKFVGDGIQTITNIDVPAKERIKAAELIGKRYGIFTDKFKAEGVIPVVITDDLEDD